VQPIEDGTTFLRVGASASTSEVLVVYAAVFAGLCFLMYKFAACCAARGASKTETQKTKDQAINELVEQLQRANQMS